MADHHHLPPRSSSATATHPANANALNDRDRDPRSSFATQLSTPGGLNIQYSAAGAPPLPSTSPSPGPALSSSSGRNSPNPTRVHMVTSSPRIHHHARPMVTRNDTQPMLPGDTTVLSSTNNNNGTSSASASASASAEPAHPRANPNRYSTYLPPPTSPPPHASSSSAHAPSSSDRSYSTAQRRRSTPKARDALLLFTTAHGGRQEYPLALGTTNIGRKEDNHISLQCAKISKFHAAIERTEAGYILRDRNSSNGVKLNDVFISQAVPLADGDRIQIGSVVLTFLYVDSRAGYVEHAGALHQQGAQGGMHQQYGPYGTAGRRNNNNSGNNNNYAQGSSASSSGYPYDDPQGGNHNIELVTILPSEQKYEETVSIRAEIEDQATTDFPMVADIHDMATLKEDYEKLRLAYELSKMSYTSEVNDHLTKMLELMFSVLPVDRGVVLLVDKATNLLVTTMVKLREGKGYEGREILLSSTILQRVYKTRKSLITSDACEDPDLGKSKSIAKGQIRSVICVPLIAHEEVLGIVHLDSRDRIGQFMEKDLALVQTIINQTALQIENSEMFARLQQETRMTEHLKRFLPPQVIQRMEMKEGVIKKGGRETTATIVFADIRGFTRLSEKCSPAEVFDLLNDYFERLVQIVFKYNGVVDKFIGDELMAVFGTLGDDNNDPTYSTINSVMAAIEFKQAIDDMNRDRVRQGKEPIAIGVGLNTGRLITGFMGSSQRLEYTCIGDTVNLASRICGFAAADQVLISEDTWRYVRGRVECRFQGARQFKGKERETRVYEAVAVIEDGYLENASEVSGMSGQS
ncbi:hypothetical protein BCR44DRAFT_63776 [Catenaria anguillulae PL171]|uniref:Adenylate cyclase n=1 Tax=Catenaria anguillulae PL171 TaxID=765915 RepID=A0A1Y2HB46_9FUNG|nr:hypothetical protein BCR44DRAFT_63776 [Catenaria anguillulae PL171]